MTRYALGLIFDRDLNRVVLMRKNRPDWQKGRFNGPGGKLETGEDTVQCVAREIREECGVEIAPQDWKLIATFQSAEWDMDIFATSTDKEVQTMTDEEVAWYDVDALPVESLSNIPWLVWLAIDRLRDDTIETCVVRYKP